MALRLVEPHTAFPVAARLNNPIIPAQAGIQINASWIPACAGMVGVRRVW